MLENEEENCPNEFVCPILGTMMVEPMCAPDGHSYENYAIKRWLENEGNGRSPLTRQLMPSNALYPNHNLRNLIESYQKTASKERERKFIQCDMELAYELHIEEVKKQFHKLTGSELRYPNFSSNVPFFQSSSSTYHISSFPIRHITTLSQEKILFSGDDGFMYKFNKREGRYTVSNGKLDAPCRGLHFTSNGIVYSLSSKGTLTAWNRTLSLLHTTKLGHNKILNVHFINDNLLVFSTESKEIKLFDLNQKKLIQRIRVASKVHHFLSQGDNGFIVGEKMDGSRFGSVSRLEENGNPL